MADDVQFQEPQYGQATPEAAPGSTGLIGLIQRSGLARSAQQAQYILIGVAVIAIVVAIFILISFGSGPTRPPVPNIDGTVSQS